MYVPTITHGAFQGNHNVHALFLEQFRASRGQNGRLSIGHQGQLFLGHPVWEAVKGLSTSCRRRTPLCGRARKLTHARSREVTRSHGVLERVVLGVRTPSDRLSFGDQSGDLVDSILRV